MSERRVSTTRQLFGYFFLDVIMKNNQSSLSIAEFDQDSEKYQERTIHLDLDNIEEKPQANIAHALANYLKEKGYVVGVQNFFVNQDGRKNKDEISCYVPLGKKGDVFTDFFIVTESTPNQPVRFSLSFKSEKEDEFKKIANDSYRQHITSAYKLPDAQKPDIGR